MPRRILGIQRLGFISVAVAIGALALILWFNSQASATIDSSLKGYWKFDENSGTTAADSSGNGYDGTLLNGATFSGGAVELDDASNQYVSIGDRPGLAITGDMTITARIYPTSFAGEGHIVSRRAAGCGAMGYQVNHHVTGEIRGVSGPAPLSDSPVDSGLMLNLNAWNFVGVTHDGATHQWFFNVNGTTASGIGGALETGAGTVLIGQANGCTGVTAFEGCIDEVKIFNRKLSPSELAGKATPTPAPTCTPGPPTPGSVGGVVELPHVDGAPLEVDGPSGSGAGMMAGIAGTAAVALVVGGAAWYARKKRGT